MADNCIYQHGDTKEYYCVNVGGVRPTEINLAEIEKMNAANSSAACNKLMQILWLPWKSAVELYGKAPDSFCEPVGFGIVNISGGTAGGKVVAHKKSNKPKTLMQNMNETNEFTESPINTKQKILIFCIYHANVPVDIAVSIFSETKNSHFISILIQYLNIVNIMNSLRYYHGNIWIESLALCATKKKYIKMYQNRYKIRTNGRILKFVGYGGVNNDNSIYDLTNLLLLSFRRADNVFFDNLKDKKMMKLADYYMPKIDKRIKRPTDINIIAYVMEVMRKFHMTGNTGRHIFYLPPAYVGRMAYNLHNKKYVFNVLKHIESMSRREEKKEDSRK